MLLLLLIVQLVMVAAGWAPPNLLWCECPRELYWLYSR